MSILGQFAGITAAFLLTIGGTQAAHAEPLRISYVIQVGSGPFFVAQDKGFFAKEGVDVALVNIEDHAAIFAAMDASQIDAVQGAIQESPLFSKAKRGALGLRGRRVALAM